MQEERKNLTEGCCPSEGEGLIPEYYAQCKYYWPEFFDKGAFVYSEVRFCSHRVKLDCDSMEEAEKIVAEMNHTACPVCGKVGKLKATTNFDMINDQRIIDQLLNTALNSR